MNATQDTNTKEVSRFGNGRYSPLMSECFADLQAVFDLSEEQADKIARQIGSEIGALMANQSVTIKLGSVNKDGKLTIAEAAKIKNVTMTNTLFTLKALQFANEALKNGFNRKETKWVAIPRLQEYFDSV